ncbi:MAG: deoxyribose-phosphate aldolase [Nitratireductor sp.]|nr:deoxyribose-phosphate aldolase [Nitratireductor sp.]
MSRKDALKQAAAKAISLLDLTNLNDVCTPADIADLCARATTPHGKVAAICIWKEHVRQARKLLKGTGIRIATVVNFPAGGTDVDAVIAETEQAIADGADEIDLVLPYRALIVGAEGVARYMVRRIARTCRGKALLKVIIETGELKDVGLIRRASGLSIEEGADFIKTSTGKVPVNATPEAAEIMLKVIARTGRKIGFKPAGGIRTTADAAAYLDLAARIMGRKWAGPRTLRFGASSVLADLLATLDGKAPAKSSGGY